MSEIIILIVVVIVFGVTVFLMLDEVRKANTETEN